MTDAREALERYAAEVPAHEEDPREESAPEAFAAVRAVLDLHVEERDGSCTECFETCPCPTVRSIQTALGDTTP